jgi:hypothetical protein
MSTLIVFQSIIVSKSQSVLVNEVEVSYLLVENFIS